MFNKWLIAIFVFIGVGNSVDGQVQHLLFEHLSTGSGLSNNRVYSIYQDRKGFIWFGTLDGLNRYDGYSFKVYKNNPEDTFSLQENRVVYVYEDSRLKLWLGTEKHGVIRFDPSTETFYQYTPARYGLPIDDAVYILENNKKQINVGFNNSRQTYVFDSISQRFNQINHSNHPYQQLQNRLDYYARLIKKRFHIEDRVESYLEEKNGYLWIGTYLNGLFLGKVTNQGKDTIFYQYGFEPLNNKLEIKCIYQDRSGIIWIGTRNNGVFKHNPASRQFKHYNYFKNDKETVTDITVRAITEDQNKNLWIGTYNNGIIKYNRTNHTFDHIILNGRDKTQCNMIRGLYTDHQGNVWVGSYGGVAVFAKGNGAPQWFETEIENPKEKVHESPKLHYNRVYSFATDYFGNIWLANWKGLTCYIPSKKIFKHYTNEYFGVNNIRKVYIDKNNIVWVGCEFGGLIKFDQLSQSFERYYPGKNTNNNLINENVFDIHEDADGNFWVSTFNGLDRLDRNKGEFTHFFSNHGLPSNMIYGILNDNHGNLWFTTTNGISRLDIRTNHFRNYDEKSGILTNEFAEGGLYRDPSSGEFVVGGINGFLIFHPDSIKVNLKPPKVAITGVKIMNELVEPRHGKRGDYLKQAISYSDEITLKPQDKMLTIEFSALDFTIPEKNTYRYKLEGFDHDWVNTDQIRRSATYTNLPSGKYVFRVKAANNDGTWSNTDCTLKIKILPPFWATWWAFVVYAGLAGLFLWGFRLMALRRTMEKNALDIERIKHEKAEELNQIKLNFFTNISHEFRTPLTLILAPLENIRKAMPDRKLSEFRKQHEIVYNNARRLLQLTNQIMDLRKLETGNLQLRASQANVSECTETIVFYFRELAKQKTIALDYQMPEAPVWAWIDLDKYEKIVYNLLSNAMKFSHEQAGRIEINLEVPTMHNDEVYAYKYGQLPNEQYFELSVIDNGIGIPENVIDKIFNQFYQVQNSVTLNIQGAGIGLAILKELVLLHQGQILVKSREGEGSLFTIRFPLGKKHLDTAQMVNGHPEESYSKVDRAPVLGKPVEFTSTGPSKKNAETLLIADDSAELRNYLRYTLGEQYNIVEAENGRTAIKLTFEKTPDLVLSDVMMPDVNGIDLCKRLKNDIRTSHIPIILLTARTSDEQRTEGYLAKADDYIIKPFNIEVLSSRIRNLIDAKANLQKAILEHSVDVSETWERNEQSPQDVTFVNSVKEFVLANITDANMSVEQLSRQMGMSRSNFHLKMKHLTGLSATDFIRTLKLNQAVELLARPELSVVEIAFKAGFNTPSYFIKCFREKYGVTPKEYRERV